MCGICGGLSWDKPLDAEALGRMLRTLIHRGPDDEGTHLAAPVALGARRLSIIDLQTGHQPISNEDDSVWVVQNGEIYNYLELRQELEVRGHRFRTKCDTEVLVHLYEERGEDFVPPLVGMFAIAVWDARAGKLVLARDRLGKKPMYYSPCAGEGLLFGSEIKALLASGRVSREMDWAALGEYFTKLYIGGESTIYRDIRQVRPGHLLVAERGGFRTKRYWDPWSIPRRAGPLREDELVEELGTLLRQAVKLRLRSDVPLGCFLSGGIDSSLVAALACEATSKLKTFTIGFGRADYDESPAARELARHLGTEHREFRVEGDPEDTNGILARLPEVFDQPFGDSSAVPTWHVAHLTRQEVTVALSGDGGDEVFGGYRRYLARRWAERYNHLPRPLRQAAGALAGRFGEPSDVYGGGLRNKLRRFTAYARQVEGAPATSRQDFFTPPMLDELLQPEAREQLRSARTPEDWPQAAGLDPVDAAMRRDLVDYLPDDILAKVDRVSMDVSLEARAPLLDHRVVEFMLSLPVEWKLRGSTGKYLLRRFAGKVLPAEVLRRPKHGFALSLRPWFRSGGEGRRHLEELCGTGPLQPLVRTEGVRDLLEHHDAGRADLSEHLWALVVLGSWQAASSSHE